ncbi:MAG: SDR family NAD(P)-dependent oxidoreductase, partial [Candidatus Hodarchaeota archaeon]
MTKTRFLEWENPGKAVVTGSSSGIGAEYAWQLADLGFTPILVARRKEKLENLAKELEAKFEVSPEVTIVDLSDLEQIHKFAGALKERSDIDILVNNAGFGLTGGFRKNDVQKHLNMMRVHMDAPVILTHAVIPQMV